jgi:hypothetical protein
LKIGSLDWRILAAAAAIVAAGIAAAFQMFRRPPDPEEIERQRRMHLNRVGRIVEGHIVELLDVEAPPPPRGFALRKASADNQQRKLVCYSYSISGVSYETAQDVTSLQASASLGRITAGQPASVKYDPSNPSNSILVADNWSGVR